MTDSLEAGSGEPSMQPDQQQPAVQAVDVAVLVKYFKTIVPALLEDDNHLHPSLENLVNDATVIDKMRKFILDPQTKAFLIQRTSAKGLSCLLGC